MDAANCGRRPAKPKAAANPAEAAWDRAVRMLAASDRSEHEIRLRLADTDAAIVADVLRRLRHFGYLDEARFARGLCERLARRGYGSDRARAELAEHRLAHDLIDNTIVEMAEGDADRARAHIDRLYPDGLHTARERARAGRILHNRGYSEAVVLAIVGEDW